VRRHESEDPQRRQWKFARVLQTPPRFLVLVCHRCIPLFLILAIPFMYSFSFMNSLHYVVNLLICFLDSKSSLNCSTKWKLSKRNSWIELGTAGFN
jgi:hypothetical protein